MKYIFLGLCVLSLYGCFKDCSGTHCNSNQISAIGSHIGDKCYCACNQFAEGTNCSVFKSQKFIGVYTGNLIINDSAITSQTLNIAFSLNDSALLTINNGNDRIALSADTASLYVQIRAIDIFFSTPTSGIGYLSTDLKRLTLNYQIGITGNTTNYTFIGLRQ